MPAPYTGMRRKIEDCVANYIRSTYDLPTDWNLYRSMDVIEGDGVKAPCVLVVCPGTTPFSGDSLGPNCGISNRVATINVVIKTPAQDKKDGDIVTETCSERHERVVGSILDTFYRTDIVDALNAMAEPGIGVDQFDYPEETMNPEKGIYVTTLAMTITIHPTGD